MNEVSKVFDFAVERFQADTLVNTITLVKTEDLNGNNNIDLNKENVYPLVNVDLQFSDPTDDFIILKYEIHILTQRDVRPTKTDSKLQLDTNLVDNLNETHSIANRFLSYLRRQNNPDVIELLESSDLVRLEEFGDNKDLDGWSFTCQLSIFNKGSVLLDFVDDDKIKDEQSRFTATQHLIRVSADQGFVLDYECLVAQIKDIL